MMEMVIYNKAVHHIPYDNTLKWSTTVPRDSSQFLIVSTATILNIIPSTSEQNNEIEHLP